MTRAKFGFQESSDMSEETRRLRLEAFLAKNHFITRREYSGLTGLLKGKAQRELNLLVENKEFLTLVGMVIGLYT